MIRNSGDTSHAYCAVEGGNTHKIMKLALNPENPSKAEARDFFVLSSSLVAGVEFDPEVPGQIYIVDDGLSITRVYEDDEGRGIAKSRVVLQPQTFDDELR